MEPGREVSPGIQEHLRRLGRRYTLAIITNTHDPSLVRGHLECMGVTSLFEAVVTSVEFGLRKPHPAIFHHALALLGVKAQSTIYVGDSYEADYVGALSAGIPALLIDPERELDVPSSDRLDSIFALEAALTTDMHLSPARDHHVRDS